MTLVRCVGGILHDEAGRLLLIRRANEPSRGLWTLPGGRVETGESDAEAVARELREETGLEVLPGELVGTIVRGRFEIHDYRCTPRGGVLRPGDDAADARWVDGPAFTALASDGRLTESLPHLLRTWRALPSPLL
ncbi:NUDIX hydrolase [Amycolatopsis cihanbeyliensis]|uniref:ADP-ribose pyrophosphatase YjhB (NUDIX family) n=1 Tax=Amycolatopsis cihanbeyliensis TaxID=1128664 RepID=A0A542DP33_AMYCI|nr:NUDIX domain-containing protein [Amycolatopsis cihanbeyliensis]TQJ04863.1 ADP-ribose pyrophosphatase YjhB (NUDIX family) [Amycolatopsis cihanbeyliensis]